MEHDNTQGDDLLELTASVVAAYVGNNRVSTTEISDLIASIHQSFGSLGTVPAAAPEPVALVPAVPIKKSVTPDYIICLEDGKHFKSMKRHLMTKFGMTPNDYRRKWGLPSDYPMVAADYATKRSELAMNFGLGRKKKEPADEPETEKPARKASRKNADAS
ncbi:MAG: MucR family transcriptional regulator [Oxalobacteraceae bacterium]|nr:MAG: MucR family transcriptional regulator [Oxalobacteraceae bacterium]